MHAALHCTALHCQRLLESLSHHQDVTSQKAAVCMCLMQDDKVGVLFCRNKGVLSMSEEPPLVALMFRAPTAVSILSPICAKAQHLFGHATLHCF